MRILHVDTAAGWRGGQNQVLLTAAGSSRRGHDVRVLCRRGGVLAERARSLGLHADTARLGGGDLSPMAILAVARAVRRQRSDVVQLHDPHGLAAGLLARRVSGVPARLVATRRVDFALRGAVSRRKYRGCDRVIAVSQAIARVLEAGGLDPDRVRLVHEGVPDRPPAAGGTDALEALGVPRGARVVGVVAALTDHKDHDTLLRAAAEIAARRPSGRGAAGDIRFVLAGEGDLRGRLETLARELGIGGSCVFAGFRGDLDRLIPAFDVFCLSSHKEGLGTSLLDAMCFSRPVVATRAGGIPEAVEDGVTGLLVPIREPAALARALLDVLDSPERARALGEAGRRRFLERFTDGRMVEGTIAVYREIA